MIRLHQSREPNRYRKRGMFFCWGTWELSLSSANLNNLSRNSCVDAIEIKLTATDDGDVTCKEQGQTSCKSASLNLNLRIRETNKPPFCSKTTSGTGSSCRDLFQAEEDRTLGLIPEYSAPEVTFDDQNKERSTFYSFYVIVMTIPDQRMAKFSIFSETANGHQIAKIQMVE